MKVYAVYQEGYQSYPHYRITETLVSVHNLRELADQTAENFDNATVRELEVLDYVVYHRPLTKLEIEESIAEAEATVNRLS